MTDHYADGTCQWWHLSRPSPELIAALGDGWQIERMERAEVPSDTRMLNTLLARLATR